MTQDTNLFVRDQNGITYLLPWYKIQEDLENLEIDLLLLFDCCFAAQAGRANDVRLGRFELLAAAPMGMMTPKPGPKSFTVALMKEIKVSFQERNAAVVIDIHGKLVARQAYLHATPVHVPLRSGKRSIRLERIPESTAQSMSDNIGDQAIHVAIHTRDDLGRLDEEALVQWLGEDRPHNITSVKILKMARNVQDFVASMENEKTPLTRSLNALAADNLSNARDKMTLEISRLQSLSEHPGLRPHSKTILRNLEAANSDFTEILSQSVISIRNDEDKNIIEEALSDPMAKSMGIVNALKMRQIIYSADLAPTDLLEDETIATVRPSIQEKKSYQGYFTEDEKEALRYRIRHLAVLLSAPKDRGFQSLRCYRCEHEIFASRYTLHFEIPADYKPPTDENLTLIGLIEKAKKAARPSLDERLQMGYALAKAVYNWHSAGWLHQGIASPSVRFFRLESNNAVDFSQPFLQGFDFARPESDPSLGTPTKDPYFDVYRHPSRQGPARQGHKKTHDYYALGVVLLEIGLWQSTTKMLDLVRKPMSPRAICEALRMHCTERLAHYAGKSYQEAVERCLNTRFDVTLDNNRDSQLMQRFHGMVVLKLGDGISVR